MRSRRGRTRSASVTTSGSRAWRRSTRRSSRPSQDGRLARERLEQAAERVARVGRDGARQADGVDRRGRPRGRAPGRARAGSPSSRGRRSSSSCGPPRRSRQARPGGPRRRARRARPRNGRYRSPRLSGGRRRPAGRGATSGPPGRPGARDAHRHEWERETAEAVLATTRDAVVVELGLPLWRPRGGAGYVATHGAARANVIAAAEVLAGFLGADDRRRRRGAGTPQRGRARGAAA